MISVTVCDSRSEWDEYVLTEGGHPLQLWGWGDVKQEHGWKAERVFVREGSIAIGGAQLLIKKLPFPFRSLVYIPRGPVGETRSREVVLEALARHVKSAHGAVAISVEPDWTEMVVPQGWHKSDNTILIPHTLVLDLAQSEDELLGAMARKTRQYIRKSGSEESVTIRRVKNRSELRECLAMYSQTAARAGFAIHDNQYYYDVYDRLGDHSVIFASFVEDHPVAFLWLAVSESVAFELYGGMNDDGQRLRANYALKWHAISKTREWGIERYDMNGLLGDGISTFKKGFATHESLLVGTYDKPLSPLYKAWAHGLPVAKKAVRKLKSLRK